MTRVSCKVALVTGGVSGIGLDVVHALVARGDWQIHIVDSKDDPGDLPPSCVHHKADITVYNDLAEAFKAAFEAGGRRLDFVFANAGIFERGNWYAPSGPSGTLPPEPDWSALETNLKGCINTVRIGRHYMAQSPGPDRGSIVVTSSIAGIWPSYFSPIYTASKRECLASFLIDTSSINPSSFEVPSVDAHTDGVLGFMRSVAEWYYSTDKIRVNALCPSIVRTDILPNSVWDKLPLEAFTPLSVVTKVVLMFIDGELITDSSGKTASKVYGQAVMPSRDKFYLNDMPVFCDEVHRSVVEGTHVAHMLNAV